MRRFYCTVMATFLVTCCSIAQGQSRLAMSEKNQKLRTIYLKIKGPEDAATKLRASFAEAAADKDMFLADDPHQASSKVDVTIKERKVEKEFYAEVVSATLVARDGKSATVSTCNKVTDGKGYSTITKKTGSTSLMKDVPAKSAIFIEVGSQPAALIQGLQKEVREAGFEIVSTEKEADFQLKDIRLVKAPVRGDGVELNIQSTISAAGGPVLNMNSSVTSHISIHEPIGLEAEACRSSLQHLGEDGPTPYIHVALADVAMITQFIK